MQNSKEENKKFISLLLYFIGGDGRKGYAPGQPFDAIHVGAAASEMPPAVSGDLLLFISKQNFTITVKIHACWLTHN